MTLSGIPNRSSLPSGLSTLGDIEADAERCDAVARNVRGAGYGPDLAFAGCEQGFTLLTCGDDGYGNPSTPPR